MRLHPFRAVRPRARSRRAGGRGAVRRGEPRRGGRAGARAIRTASSTSAARTSICPADVDPYDAADLRDGPRGARPASWPRARWSATPTPSLYLYRQIMDGRAQTGVVGLRAHRRLRAGHHPEAREDPAGQGRRPHPPRAHAQRQRGAGVPHLPRRGRRSTALTAADPGRRRRSTTSPRRTASGTPSGGSPTPGRSLEAFGAVPHAYVADGHHRSASAWRAGRELRSANPAQHRGDEEYNWFLAVLFPAEQLRILPYNRVVRDLGGLAPGARARRGSRGSGGCVTATRPGPGPAGQLRHLSRDGRWYRLELDPSRRSTGPTRSARSTCPCCRTGCWARSSASATRAPTSGSISWAASGARRSSSGGCARARWRIAFSLYPTTLDQLMAVSDAGQIMPPKSTWFEPKLRSGLFVHTL